MCLTCVQIQVVPNKLQKRSVLEEKHQRAVGVAGRNSSGFTRNWLPTDADAGPNHWSPSGCLGLLFSASGWLSGSSLRSVGEAKHSSRGRAGVSWPYHPNDRNDPSCKLHMAHGTRSEECEPPSNQHPAPPLPLLGSIVAAWRLPWKRSHQAQPVKLAAAKREACLRFVWEMLSSLLVRGLW